MSAEVSEPSSVSSSEVCNAATLAHIRQLCATRIPASPIYAFLLMPVSILLASRGRIVASLKLSSLHVNSSGGIHGGVSATIVDWAGGMAIAAWDLREGTGVSVEINVSYLGRAEVGDIVRIEAWTERVGGSLAVASVKMRKENGEAVIVGRHTKFVKGSGKKQVGEGKEERLE